MDYRARIIGPGVLRLLANDLPDLAHDEVVFVSIERGRSPNSHKHQFAWVNDAWQNLPEAEALQPYAETAETLRKHALIATGYHRTYTIDCGGKATAQRIKAELLRAETKAEGYALAQVKGPILRIWTPEMAERATMPDGIDARDAAIGLLDEDIARLSASLVAEVTESEALRAQLTEARAGEDELAEAARRWTGALDAMREFERDNPNNTTKAWDLLFYSIQFAEEAARAALASHDKRKEGR